MNAKMCFITVSDKTFIDVICHEEKDSVISSSNTSSDL